ncbi:MAG: formylmethanofuran--tetrahydromethanopterin N-formyltransferase [Theionarchaea archaeon]|nr:formylmethanofuran--tetrahydromethanopterin N-formyltransferase [Theionarchaea archaeon]
MQINGVTIEDTFAEAFKMYASRVLITAINEEWAMNSAITVAGFGTSVIMCGCETGIENTTTDTPDGRPGVNVLIFANSAKDLGDQLMRRIGQCVMTSPTSACFNNVIGEKEFVVGGALRYFGDGFQISKRLNPSADYPKGRRFWRIPVMGGEFFCEEKFQAQKAVGGGNFLIIGKGIKPVLTASEKAVQAIRKLSNVIAPFPGGVVRSGSKVGSIYKFLTASTNTAFCPSVKSQVLSQLTPEENSVLEIVIDALDIESMNKAMHDGIHAACTVDGVTRISAGNYGGNLGKFIINLKEVI